ncbi:radical SAM/SPASM domain-containing protein [Flammeovirga pacifica]|uniref:Radical SAM protein n=1 Tax=Flammeovirga pacifica TaxID=915059 RepID=A0A1S1YXZ4_FLAPC|nr:radical SAM/SPASM domain-containing protein [Flammeovirga pacifica]OHX65877.1 radical SAM protein [Flammeovirga pacifica]
MRKLSLRKIYNAFLIFISYQISKYLGWEVHWGDPISIAIEPTTSCNLRCPECPSGLRSFTRDTGMLSTSLFENVIQELQGTLMNLTFYFQGEPYLNKNFLKMVKIADEHKVFTSTSTNAHYLNDQNADATVKSGLDRLIVSLDGTTQETYEKYRIGGDIEKVLDGIRNIVAAKDRLKSKTPEVVIQFLVVRPNEHQIEEAKELAKELKVDDIQFKTAQIYDYENGSPLIPTLDQYSRYQKTDDGKYQFKGKWERHCWRLWNSAVITWDGNVVPCCFDKDAKYVLGTLKNDYIGFRKIWRNKSYVSFRKQLLKGREKIDICKNCTEGLSIYN